jgi:Serine carboxypeptidase S28
MRLSSVTDRASAMKLFFFLVFLCSIEDSWAFFGYTRKFNSHNEPLVSHTKRFYWDDSKAIQEKWINQRLDHFNPQDNRMWKMRYLENNVHFQDGGPIFIYVGGEWEISSGSISSGSHIFDMAGEHNGTIYYTEHRFYGQSRPLNNTSTENLRFLNIDQALADLAFFINYAKASSSGLANSSVIMVGGSYSGKYLRFENVPIISVLCIKSFD